MYKQLKGALPCFLTALIWGSSFVAQTTGMRDIDGFTFTGVRMVFAVAALLPATWLSMKFSKAPKEPPAQQRETRKMLWIGGVLCGLCLFGGNNLQQFAFAYTSAGKVGFLTALYMIEVAVLGTVVLRKRIALPVWISIAMAMGGIFLLCMRSGAPFTIGRGELLSIGCSFFFAVQILICDKYAQRVNVIAMSCIQFAVAGALSLVCMAVFEEPTLHSIRAALPELLYCGVISCALAFTLQLYGQKYADPVLASMLLCFESVFSVLFGWLLLHQSLSARELTGCAVMFAAVFLTLIPPEMWSRLRNKIIHSE